MSTRKSWDDYGISKERYAELRSSCRTGEYGRNVLVQACTGIPEEIAIFIIKSVQKGKSYDFLEFDLELGRIPCGRTDFYGYRRAFYYNLDCLQDKQKSRKGAKMNSREKGAEGERELSHVLQGYGYECRRGQQYCGANGDADVVGLPGVHIECKRVERLNISEAMKQAAGDARTEEMPAVFHRKNREGWLVTVTLDDFMKLYQTGGKEIGNR